MKKMTTLETVAYALVIVGALNWGLVALGWDAVGSLGEDLSRIVYILVGLSGVYMLWGWLNKKK